MVENPCSRPPSKEYIAKIQLTTLDLLGWKKFARVKNKQFLGVNGLEIS